MVYNNLIFFLIAIVVFSTSDAGQSPNFLLWQTVAGFFLVLYGFFLLVNRLFKGVGYSSARYFAAEKKCTVSAVIGFFIMVYLLDIKHYLSVFSFGDRFPSLVNIIGLSLFFIMLALLWGCARRSYQNVFNREYSNKEFILYNVKSNLPIILPWLVLSLLYDFIGLLPFPALHETIESVWGDLLFFFIFLLAIMFFFPPLVRRLWGCVKLPEGELRTSLEQFCAKQNFKAELYLWPLFEGRILTAGVMGFVPGLRYILLTPAIIETMTQEELEAVVAHEIGHVKRFHLFLYVLLLGGFSVFIGFLIEPALRVLFSFSFLINFMVKSGITPEEMFTYAGTFGLLIFLVIYFRFIFGYFIRNFERQADLHVFSAIGHPESLISAFERIAVVSGNVRDKPSWHHFGIGERVDYLELCKKDTAYIKRQDKKVNMSLFVYILVLALTVFMVGRFPTEKYIDQYKEKYTEAFLVEKIESGLGDSDILLLAGDFMLYKKREDMAIKAYEAALLVDENNPEILNNLSWILLTSEDLGLRDPGRALTMSRAAASVQPKGHILDTLARSYWANGFLEEALATEKQAIFVDLEKGRYYLRQAELFRSTSYEEVVERKLKEQRGK